MSQATEDIAKQFANAAVNKKNWGAVAYNVFSEGLSGDGVSDDTAKLQALINKAIAANRRTILFPHGQYYVTALTNADQVDFVGDNSSFVGGYTGTIGNLGGFAALEAEFNAFEAEYATLNINLAHYANFEALANKADITNIIKLAMADLATQIVGASGWHVCKVSIFIPGGQWTVSEKRLFDLSKYGLTNLTPVRGFNIKGAGCENTELFLNFNPADLDNYLVYDSNKFGFSRIEDLRLTSVNGTERGVYLETDPVIMNTQSITFNHVIFDGLFEAVHIEGQTGASELDFYSCKIWNTPVGGNGVFCNNPNALNHNFYATEFEVIKGNALNYKAGGCVNLYGGSVISWDAGIILKVDDASGSQVSFTSSNFNFYGVRAEFHGTSKLFDIQAFAHINFNGCNLVKEIDNAGAIRGVTHGMGAVMTFTDCSVPSKFYAEIFNADTYLYPPVFVFDRCRRVLPNIVDYNAIPNVSGNPLVIIKNAIANVGDDLLDVTYGKGITKRPMGIDQKMYFFRAGFDTSQGLPSNTPVSFKMPLNSIILRIRIIHKPTAAHGATSNDYFVKNYDNSVTFASATAVANTADGSVATSNNLWYEIDTEAKRVINVSATGSNFEAPGYVVVEYV